MARETTLHHTVDGKVVLIYIDGDCRPKTSIFLESTQCSFVLLSKKTQCNFVIVLLLNYNILNAFFSAFI